MAVDLVREALRDTLMEAMIGRASAKYKLAGLEFTMDTMMAADLNEAANVLTIAVWNEHLAPLLAALDRDNYIIEGLCTALDGTAEEILSHIEDEWEAQHAQ